MASQNPDLSPAMTRALELLRAGQTVPAEEILVRAVQEAEQRTGPESPETASAYNDLANLLLHIGNPREAVAAYRRACAGPMPTPEQARRDRLTYLMNFGMALQQAGELDEAEQILREGLAGREQFYGIHHAGYAFGLEPLATLLMRRGKFDEALAAFDETVANFQRNQHPRLVTALALRAECLRRAGRPGPLFPGIEGLSNETVQGIVEHVVGRFREAEPGILSPVLQALLPALKARFGPDHASVSNVTIHIVNLESQRGKEGDVPVRLALTREMIASNDRQRRPREATQALLALALGLKDAGQTDEAVATYESALERARQLRDAGLHSTVARNFGLLLAEMNREPEAEVQLKDAIEAARVGSSAEQVARGQIALGIFYQHRKRLEEARPLLAAGVPGLPAAHPDAVVGRSHLQALEAGRTCGCDNQREAIADAFRAFVLERLPQDLLDRFEVRLENNDFAIEVHLNRAPTEEEVAHLNRVVTHALNEFRNRLGQRD
jgi:tetratricopeptide (TPR) repeat protein